MNVPEQFSREPEASAPQVAPLVPPERQPPVAHPVPYPASHRAARGPFGLFVLPNWLKWLIGSITFLGAAILVLSLVLGVRAGQRQLEIQSRQQIGIDLQNALDHRAQGDLEAALAAYQRVLTLDPDNAAAAEGIESLLGVVRPDGAAGGDDARGDGAAANEQAGDDAASRAVLPPSVPNGETADSSGAVDGAAAQPPDPLDAEWSEAQAAYNAGRWEDAVEQITAIRTKNPDYRADYVSAMLYNAYLNLAAQKDLRNDLEGALELYDKAITLQPSADAARTARAVVAGYVDVLQMEGADWERTVEALKEIYELDAGYRDVRERLQRAHMQYGDALVRQEAWCDAAQQYSSAIAIQVTPGAISKRDTYQSLCVEGGGSAVVVETDSDAIRIVEPTEEPAQTSGSTVADSTAAQTDADVAEAAPAEPTAATQRAAAGAVSGSPTVGRILYSARDVADGRNRIFAQPVDSDAQPTMLVEDAAQPALRSDGQRLAYRNLQDDRIGISSFDPGSGLQLRFTKFAEDQLPSWSPDGNRVVFASNREGDRRWRLYTVWAEEGGATANHSFGEAPEWHPTADIIAFRGCDEQGNRCGLWTMNGNGGNRQPLTDVPADTRPTWTPDGSAVVFMSSARHGNWDIYRVGANGGAVTRLTEHGANDVTPTVSPDGQWVAFLSDRNGAWQLWAVPISGGEAQLVSSIQGNIGSWLEQDIQWVR